MIWLVSYIMISGLIMWFMLHSITALDKVKEVCNKEEKEKIEELQDWIYVNFGNRFFDLLPTIELLSLIFGWLLLPIVLYEYLFNKEEI